MDPQLGCRLFGSPKRPAVCSNLRPSPRMCGSSRGQALRVLAALEHATRP
ncbi:proteinase inhibitor [Xanthomonas cucurbitae]|uniref:Proteinase inhibitor n=1 Tax=Xanthomonas cucurbitae TaxID=56453 RepID=A0A2S7DTT6_9XANT|nr:proteinase inhibitor [Xanthomonas cucurbitae]QHG88948.1 proteinase inhibitor [Xanthomonas cucurbitae]